MKINLCVPLVFFAVSVSSILSAQGPPPFAGPEPEHKWLHNFVGQWETKMESPAGMEGPAGPNEPPTTFNGEMSSQMLGEFWVLNEMKFDMLDTPMKGMQTIGYDPATKKYVGTWVDSVSNLMWRYEGTVDETGKKLTLEADGPNFAVPGKTTKFRDAYELKSANQFIATSTMLGEDGKWVTFMTGTMTRKK